MKNSRIEWTEATWNPLRGCTRVSEGCRFCYAERVALRWSGEGQPYEGLVKPAKDGGHPRWTGEIMLVEKQLNAPRKWKEGKLIFVNSMSDLFHEKVPREYIDRVFEVMRETPQHTYQILTKRAFRLHKMSALIEWPQNVWIGVSVEDDKVTDRIAKLQRTGGKVKFLSLEPLIGPIDSVTDRGRFRKDVSYNHDYLRDIDWVIVGGESGDKARIMETEWAEQLVDACRDAEVPVFVKQMGTAWSKQYGDGSFKGDDIESFPESLRIREYPARDNQQLTFA